MVEEADDRINIRRHVEDAEEGAHPYSEKHPPRGDHDLLLRDGEGQRRKGRVRFAKVLHAGVFDLPHLEALFARITSYEACGEGFTEGRGLGVGERVEEGGGYRLEAGGSQADHTGEEGWK